MRFSFFFTGKEATAKKNDTIGSRGYRSNICQLTFAAKTSSSGKRSSNGIGSSSIPQTRKRRETQQSS
jgi:hypothetical protein